MGQPPTTPTAAPSPSVTSTNGARATTPQRGVVVADQNRKIPPESRVIVWDRSGGRCERCGGRASEWHHRRPRGIRDTHRHCACVGLATCGSCHRWIHSQPAESRSLGLIVSRYEEEPWKIPVQTVSGWAVMTCDGRALWTVATERLDHLEQNCVKVTTTSSAEAGHLHPCATTMKEPPAP